MNKINFTVTVCNLQLFLLFELWLMLSESDGGFGQVSYQHFLITNLITGSLMCNSFNVMFKMDIW